jgi:hypothetical protein
MVMLRRLAKSVLLAVGLLLSAPSAFACVQCYAQNVCGPAAGAGWLRCSIGCGSAFCACVPSGLRCSVGAMRSAGITLASVDHEDACRSRANAEFDGWTSGLLMRQATFDMAGEKGTDQAKTGFVKVADGSKVPSCRMARSAAGDSVVRCGPEPTGDRVVQAMRGDVGVLIQVAEVDPDAALAVVHLQRSDSIDLADLDGGMIVVPALGRSRVMEILTLPPEALGNKMDPASASTKFRISFEWSGRSKAVFTVRLAADDPSRLQGGIALEYHQVAAAPGHYTLRRWVPLAARGV